MLGAGSVGCGVMGSEPEKDPMMLSRSLERLHFPAGNNPGPKALADQ